MARRVHRAKSFSFDLLADWRPFADSPAEGGPWIYYGTCTLNGVTGALAWKQGWNGIAVGAQEVQVLGQWEQIDVQHAVIFKRAAGWEEAPIWEAPPPSPGWGWSGWKK